MQIIEDEIFEGLTADDLRALKGSFENCTFKDCNFTGGQFYDVTFTGCKFINCDFTGSNLLNTGLQNILFQNCQLTSADFGKASDFLFEVHFTDCVLDRADFYKKKNKGGKFKGCSLKGANFAQCDLTNAVFGDCNLNQTVFDQTQLKGADFSTSFNYIIDPDANFIKKARFSVHGLAGLLSKYDIVVKG